jgi:glycosyltransferase involved in cell wall biosynthesis
MSPRSAMHSIVYDYQTFSLQQYGGISRYFCELASRVHRAPGFQARVVAPVHFNDYLRDCDVPQTALHLPKLWKTGPLFRATNQLLWPACWGRHSPSLIHRTFFAPFPASNRVPSVVTIFDMINELFPETFPSSDRTAANKRLCVERAEHVLCISESTANDLVRLCGVPRERISVTYLGCSDVFADEAPDDEPPPQPRPYLLYVGHRAGHKNFDAMLEAYAGSRQLRTEFDLVVFGGLHFNRAERERIAELHIPQARVIRWSGSDAELARAYRHARALVYPSKYEGFGIPPLEAMSARCAVACSNVSSIPEVVGNAARLFDPNDLQSVLEAMEAVALNDGLRSNLIAAGLTRSQLFSWDRCADQTLAAYRPLVGQSSAQ